MPENKSPNQDILERAILDKELPHIYFNGFLCTTGTSDTVIVLKYHDEPIAILNMSHSIAKTLADKLGGIMAGFEHAIENKILTTDEIGNKLTGAEDSDNKT